MGWESSWDGVCRSLRRDRPLKPLTGPNVANP